MVTLDDVFEQLEKDIRLSAFYAEKEFEFSLNSQYGNTNIHDFISSFEIHLEIQLENFNSKLKGYKKREVPHWIDNKDGTYTAKEGASEWNLWEEFLKRIGWTWEQVSNQFRIRGFKRYVENGIEKTLINQGTTITIDNVKKTILLLKEEINRLSALEIKKIDDQILKFEQYFREVNAEARRLEEEYNYTTDIKGTVGSIGYEGMHYGHYLKVKIILPEYYKDTIQNLKEIREGKKPLINAASNYWKRRQEVLDRVSGKEDSSDGFFDERE